MGAGSTMQDHDFRGHGTLSSLISRQLAYGASFTVLTTPPPGQGNSTTFRRKLELLETLVRSGVYVFLNDRVHAKVFMFEEANGNTRSIVGSANLTRGGLEDLIELSWLSESRSLFEKTHIFIETEIIGSRDTLEFETWRSINRESVARAKER